MMRLKTLCLLVVLLTCFACDKKKSEGPTYDYLPPIPVEALENIRVNSSFADVIYNEYGISMNWPTPQTVTNSLTYIQTGTHVAANSCQPTARIMYSTPEDLLCEMDVYISDGCLHVVLLEEGQPSSASLLTETGARFYTKIVEDFLNRG